MNKNGPPLFLMYSLSFILVMSTSSWFGMWVMMELNSLIFLCFIFSSKNLKKMESLIIYFLVQNIGSLVFLFSFSSIEMNSHSLMSCPTLLLMCALLLKLGAAPLHNWFIPTAMSCSKITYWLILSLQKSIPLLMLSLYSPTMSEFLFLMIILSSSMGTSLNFKQNIIKMILIMSSISHLAWLLISVFSTAVLQTYFIIYTLMILFFMLYLNYSMPSISKLHNKTSKYFMLFMMLGGIPPLLGFMGKFMVMKMSMEMMMTSIMLVIIFFSMGDLFIYSRMSIPLVMTSSPVFFWINKNNNFLITFWLINIMFIPLLIM